MLKSLKRTSPLTHTLLCLLSASLLTGCNDLINLILPSTGSSSEPGATYPGTTPGSSSSSQPTGSLSGVPTLRQLADHSGQEDSVKDLRTVSAEYEASLNQVKDSNSSLAVAVPVKTEVLPQDLKNAQLLPERYDESKGEWVPAGRFAWYDADSKAVWFMYSPPAGAPAAASDSLLIQQTTPATTARFRIRIYLFSNQQTASREGSHFRIHYYPARLANPAHLRTDADWASSSGKATDPNVPDYVEDLDAALNQAYDRMLLIQGSAGQVFQPFTVQDVYIADTGPDAGDSALGGPMRISNTRITNWQDMQLTAGHELVHVFEGQYYSLKGLFTGRYNRWFIEAVANYYAARANQLNEAGRRAFYGDFYNNYLSVTLTAPDDTSMYAAGHFLDWIETKYGMTVIADALRASNGNDVTGLDKAIKAATGNKSSLSSAYEDYLHEILTLPQGTDGFHHLVRDAMGSHAQGYGFLSSIMLNDRRTFAQLNKPLTPLTSVLASLNLANSDDAMLVASTNGSTGILLKSFSFPFRSERNADYTGKVPLDEHILPTTANAFVSVPHVGSSQPNKAFEQMLINSGTSSEATVKAVYYLLRPPVILSQDSSSVTWDPRLIGNIPTDYIKGFRVYGREVSLSNATVQGNWKSLGNLIPLQSGASSQKTTFTPASTGFRYELLVTVTDRFDNQWPQVQTSTGQKRLVLTQSPEYLPNGNLELGGTLRLTAVVEGLSDTRVTWKLALSDYLDPSFPVGSLSVNGNQATYTAPSKDSQVVITATSVGDPGLSQSVTVGSGGFGLCGLGGDWTTLGC